MGRWPFWRAGIVTSQAVTHRLAELVRALDGAEKADRSGQTDLLRVEKALGDPDSERSYLALAVIHAQIPAPNEVVDFMREWQVSGVADLLRRHTMTASRLTRRPGVPAVRVTGGVIIDVSDTSRSKFTTGIQRVARETLARWSADEDILLVAWNTSSVSLRTLTEEMRERAGGVTAPVLPVEVVVPYRATMVLPEIAVEPRRASRLSTIAQYSGSFSAAIGFDCIPVSTAEAAAPGMPGAFSKYLACLARFDLVVPISEASANEYRGWREMLAGAGLRGPEILPIDLPSTGVPEASTTVEKTLEDLDLVGKKIVLAVGSHEPRKNHVNFLHAAELNWREGEEFTVVMVGGQSWDTAAFDRVLARLRRKGRQILTISRAPDEVVWDLYRAAEFSVFCSVNEGFGLPIVESLASGTPVITSDFGSMRDLGLDHGALLANPRDVDAIASAMASLLTDPAELESLRQKTETLPRSTWDEYATELWNLIARP
jgi:glycosyltransferase involved in cell wall biosynthesis